MRAAALAVLATAVVSLFLLIVHQQTTYLPPDLFPAVCDKRFWGKQLDIWHDGSGARAAMGRLSLREGPGHDCRLAAAKIF